MQTDLFGQEDIEPIPGFRYQPGFLTQHEEMDLLAVIATLSLHPVQYKEHQSRCRIISYGGIYDFSSNAVRPSPELDPRFYPIRDRVADWLGSEKGEIEHLLVTEYAPGTQLGCHRDVPHYETIVGISLGSTATLRFRPYPPMPATNRESVKLELAPRSIYRLESIARWEWQHSVPPVQAQRWSITLRTKRRNKGLRRE